MKDRRSLHSFQNRFGVSQWVSESVSKWKCKTNRETMRYGQFFIFSVLFADYSNIEYSAEYSDYSFFIFFLWRNMPIIAIIPKIRFLNRIFGQVFRLFKNFFFLRKNMPIIAINPNIRFLNRIFGRVFRLFQNNLF